MLEFKEKIEEEPRVYDGIFSVTSILSVLQDPIYIRKWKEAAEDPSKVDETLRLARERGTYVHLIAKDYYRKGLKNYDEESLNKYKEDNSLPEITPSILKFLNGFNKFISLDYFIPIEVEEPFINKKLGFAGTRDSVGFYQGSLAVIDWKTSSSARIQEDSLFKYWLQLAAYTADWNMVHPDKLIEKLVIIPFTNARSSGLGEIEVVDSKILIKNYFLQFLECKDEFMRLWNINANSLGVREVLKSPNI